jgi:homoserine kinase
LRKQVYVKTPATSANLGSGFDCLGISLDFFNYTKTLISTQTIVKMNGIPKGTPKYIKNNIFIRIVKDIIFEKTGKDVEIECDFVNNIPFSRGLGSSSATIVGAVYSSFFLLDITPNKDEVLNIALRYENHPDNIAPATMGGFVVGSVCNNKVVYIKKNIPLDIKAVVLIPNVKMSTRTSRNVLPFKYSKKDCIFNISRSSLLSSAFMSENWDKLRVGSQDRIHQYYRMKNMPELFTHIKDASEHGSLMSTLSGSGSSTFSIFYKDDAIKYSTLLQKKYPNYKVLCCNFNNSGVAYLS